MNGNAGHRPILPEVEPDINVKCPCPPDHLDKTAIQLWNVLAPQLHKLGLLTNIDVHTFGEYCVYQGLFIDCCEILKNEGLLSTAKNGHKYQNPVLGIRNKASAKLKTLSQHFGLSPAARTKLSMREVAESSDLEKELFGKFKTG